MNQGSFFMESEMYKYKCTSRFTILAFVNGQITEVSSGQVIESPTPADHPFLQLIESEIKAKKTYKTTKTKKLNTKADIGDPEHGNNAKPTR